VDAVRVVFPMLEREAVAYSRSDLASFDGSGNADHKPRLSLRQAVSRRAFRLMWAPGWTLDPLLKLSDVPASFGRVCRSRSPSPTWVHVQPERWSFIGLAVIVAVAVLCTRHGSYYRWNG
jgi:hypothetical protein